MSKISTYGPECVKFKFRRSLPFTTFHYEPTDEGKWKAYFSKPEWEMTAGPNWKHALVRAALNAVEKKKAEKKRASKR